MQPINILLVLTVPPYPKNVGKTVVLGGILDYLVGAGKFKITIASFEECKILPPDVEYFLIRRPRFLNVITNIIRFGLVGERLSLQESFFRSSDAVNDIQHAIDQSAPDIIFFDTIRSQQLARFLRIDGIRVISYLEDLFSVRYARVIASATSENKADQRVLGAFAEKLPKFLRGAFESSAWIRLNILKREMLRVRKSELRAVKASDCSLLVSGEEVDLMRNAAPGYNVLELAPRLSTDISKATYTNTNWNGDPVFVFLGSFLLAHNSAGWSWFQQECLPELVKLVPQVVIKVVGKGSESAAEGLPVELREHVMTLGFVDSLDEILAPACGLISPLTFGSGIKIKVLDALRCGVPVVATPVGAEGVASGPSTGVYVESSATKFVERMVMLCDPITNVENRRNAAALYEKKYDYLNLDIAYSNIFDI